MVEEQKRQLKFIQEDASAVPWFRFCCEDCGAVRDQRLRRITEEMDLSKSHIRCAGCHGQAYITDTKHPTLGYCEVDWWQDEDGNEVGQRAPRDFMQPATEVRKAGWLRKITWKVQSVLNFLVGEG